MFKERAQVEAYFMLSLTLVISLVGWWGSTTARGLGAGEYLCSPTHVIAQSGHFSIDDLMEIRFVLASRVVFYGIVSWVKILLLRKRVWEEWNSEGGY